VATIHPLFQKSALGAAEIERMVTAYDDALRAPNLGDPGDPLKGIVAAKIIASAQMGERDPKPMTADALVYLGVYRDK
jgi:hypothetical protein